MKKKASSGDDKQPLIDADTQELLRSALASYMKEQINEKKTSQANVEALLGVVQEFLNSFIILGYTFDGTPVQYICAHNQQQADSLATLLNRMFEQTMGIQDDQQFGE